jgi:hypothetical protein
MINAASFNIWSVLILIAAVHGILLAVVLWLKKENQKANLFFFSASGRTSFTFNRIFARYKWLGYAFPTYRCQFVSLALSTGTVLFPLCQNPAGQSDGLA